MKITSAKQAVERNNNNVCVVTEYPSMDKDLDFAIVKIAGRYPEVKQAMNKVCKEMVYVHSGTGQVTVNQEQYALNPGDVVFIEPGEIFFWEGNMTLHIACTPAFYIEQHVLVQRKGWHEGMDKQVPAKHAEIYAKAPNAEYRFLKGEGHIFLNRFWHLL